MHGGEVGVCIHICITRTLSQQSILIFFKLNLKIDQVDCILRIPGFIKTKGKKTCSAEALSQQYCFLIMVKSSCSCCSELNWNRFEVG